MTLTNTHRDRVTDIWMRVAEDYRPFDIDVTTEVPVRLPPAVPRAMCILLALLQFQCVARPSLFGAIGILAFTQVAWVYLPH